MKKWVTIVMSLPLAVWFLVPDGRYGIISIFVHMALLPVSLVCLNAISVLRYKLSLLPAVSASLIGLVGGNLIGYIRWGISSGNLLDPDGETIWITQRILLYQLTFVLVGLLLAAFIRWILHKNRT